MALLERVGGAAPGQSRTRQTEQRESNHPGAHRPLCGVRQKPSDHRADSAATQLNCAKPGRGGPGQLGREPDRTGTRNRHHAAVAEADQE